MGVSSPLPPCSSAPGSRHPHLPKLSQGSSNKDIPSSCPSSPGVIRAYGSGQPLGPPHSAHTPARSSDVSHPHWSHLGESASVQDPDQLAPTPTRRASS